MHMIDVQHFRARHQESLPYIRLISACMKQKLCDYARLTLDMDPFPALKEEDEKEAYYATDEWFMDEGEEPYSFNWMCHILGYDPNWVRDTVLGNLERVAQDRRLFAPTYGDKDE